ncbi:MAG: hypothetical protein ACJ8EB_08420 [Allosphingosinicella sp.]
MRPLIDPTQIMALGTTPAGQEPNHVVCWVLKMKVSGSKIAFVYHKAWSFDMAAGKTIVDYIREYALDPDLLRGHTPNAPIDRDKTKTDLSIRSQERAYCVIITAHDNLYFSTRSEPFMVEKSGTSPDNDAYYTNPLCGWFDSSGLFKTGRTAGDGCRVAAFIADAAADGGASNPQDFSTSFNIYLDIAQTQTGDPTIRRLPLIVDPDVGYPGGHLAEPGP